jgi:hypothetical protein
MKYRKKPVVVDAFRFGHDPFPDWFLDPRTFCHVEVTMEKSVALSALIHTPEGKMIAECGDYIIRGVKGELYPCKAEIFEMTYEEAEESDAQV